MSNVLRDLYEIENIRSMITNQGAYLDRLRGDLATLEAAFVAKYGEGKIELQIEKAASGLSVRGVKGK